MAWTDSTDFLMPVTVSLFIPCVFILLLAIYATCKRRPLELIRIQRHSKKQTCYFALHTAVALFYLSLLSLNVLNAYFNASWPPEITFNLSYDYISWSLLVMFAINLQMAYTMRYDRYYTSNTSLNIALGIFYTTLMTLYVCRRVDSPNTTVMKYLIFLLCILIVLLFAYLIYKLYHKPIQKLGLLVDHYIDDIVTDKRKEDQYTDTLKNNQIELLVSGWIKENVFPIFIPIDIEQLCGMYIFHTLRKETSGGSLLTGLFSLSITTVSAKQTFHGHTVNRITKDKLETAIKKVFMYKVVGIALFVCVLIYCLRFILILIWEETVYFNSKTKNQFKLFMDIVLYVSVWIEAFCNCLLMPSNKFIYNKCCCLCTHWINSKIMKEVDIKYNDTKFRDLHSPFATELRWSFATESDSWKNTNYTYYNRQSLDSFIYTSRSRLLT